SSDRYGRITSLVVADLDYFKRVNDTHGHDAGDAVLRHTASLFMEIVRAVDVCARYGGEEFAILLPETDPAGAAHLAERLRLALESRPVRFGRTEMRVTASFGVASYPDSAPLRDGLFPAADKALYRAKADGRNCVRQAPVTAGRRAT
ncbi:MAG TPA: GGDEF domain-containing protein, partial [Gemmatimonadaceae bacterium]|nr:GGDEF domain-containing protein [Gemmatimonadaceae bacterium]